MNRKSFVVYSGVYLGPEEMTLLHRIDYIEEEAGIETTKMVCVKDKEVAKLVVKVLESVGFKEGVRKVGTQIK